MPTGRCRTNGRRAIGLLPDSEFWSQSRESTPSGIRRVYLTATLPSAGDFIKTFGVVNPVRITPQGKSGAAQRLFVFPAGRDDKQQRSAVKDLIEPRKACIIVPATKAAEPWKGVADLFEGKTGQNGIQQFADAAGNKKLVLAARYDGIDLPGDSCRVLVIDGLPKGTHLLTRFIDESLQVLALRASHTAVRMVQAIGRIFRSNTDHGAVALCGREVQGWARSPSNQSFLPPLLQQQLQLGVSLRTSVDQGQTTYADLVGAVLTGDREWDNFYRDEIESFEASPSGTPPAWLVDFAAKEQAAHQMLWEGNFAGAAERFAALADEADKHDIRYAGWFRHWEGFSYDLLGDRAQALSGYISAANARSELGRPRIDGKAGAASATVASASPQARAVAALFASKKAKSVSMIEAVEADLKYGEPTNPTEEALKTLGTLLGLNASRPDKEERTGPDVMWYYPPDKSGVALEAKTDKHEGSQYRKKEDIAQFHDHASYLAKKHPGVSFRKVIVGRWHQVTPDCHPPEDLLVAPLDGFLELTDRVKKLYQFLLGANSGEEHELVAERWLTVLGLKWPNCIDSLPSKLAVDLQNETPDGGAAD